MHGVSATYRIPSPWQYVASIGQNSSDSEWEGLFTQQWLLLVCYWAEQFGCLGLCSRVWRGKPGFGERKSLVGARVPKQDTTIVSLSLRVGACTKGEEFNHQEPLKDLH